jgi:hypothetical protein
VGWHLLWGSAIGCCNYGVGHCFQTARFYPSLGRTRWRSREVCCLYQLFTISGPSLRTDSPTDMVRTGPLLKSLDWLLIKGGCGMKVRTLLGVKTCNRCQYCNTRLACLK